MTPRGATKRRVDSVPVETGDQGVSAPVQPRRVRVRKVVVAILDGGFDDAEVVDVALATCLSRGRDLRLVHLYGVADETPTPLYEAFAREYLRGAVTIARLVPTVTVAAVIIPWSTSDPLRSELANAEILVASMESSAQVVDAGLPVRGATLPCDLMTVSGTRSGFGSGRLRFAYRLALQCELDGADLRADGATTPEALDIAWHVGIACPELSADAISAWSACAAWPPRTMSTAIRGL